MQEMSRMDEKDAKGCWSRRCLVTLSEEQLEITWRGRWGKLEVSGGAA